MVVVFTKENYTDYKRVMRNACKAASAAYTKVEIVFEPLVHNKLTTDTIIQNQCIRSAVIAATMYLEDNELVNAGTGSSLTLNGTVECDASLLNVNEQKWAAMTGISKVINPIKGVEQLYLESSKSLSHGRIPPIFLSGSSAEDWCTAHQVPMQDDLSLTQRQKDIYRNYSDRLTGNTALSSNRKRKRSEFENDENHQNISESEEQSLRKKVKLNGDQNNNFDSFNGNHGTCGVIGFDIGTKQMYVSTSSGGIWMKHPGRVGPSALIGAGFDGSTLQIDEDRNVCIGVCASGSGEYLMRYRLSSKCCQQMMQQHLVDDGEENVMDENVLNNVFNGFKKSVPDMGPLKTPTAGCLIMKVINRSEDDIHGIDVDIHWVHTSDTMGIAVLCQNQITTRMSDNHKHNSVVISGRSFQIDATSDAS